MKKLFLDLVILAILLLGIPIPVIAYEHRDCTNLNINDMEVYQRAIARSVYRDADASNIVNTNIDQSQRNICFGGGCSCLGRDCTNVNINDIEVDQRATARSVYGNVHASNIANTNIDQSQRSTCSRGGCCCLGRDCMNLNINVVNIYQIAISISVFGDARASNIADVDLYQDQENRFNRYVYNGDRDC